MNKRNEVDVNRLVRRSRMFRQRKYRVCPRCRGYDLERQWCDDCGAKGVIGIPLIEKVFSPNDKDHTRNEGSEE